MALGNIWPIFDENVAMRTSVRRLEMFESALERFNALVFGKKISSVLQLFLCKIFPYFCGKKC